MAPARQTFCVFMSLKLQPAVRNHSAFPLDCCFWRSQFLLLPRAPHSRDLSDEGRFISSLQTEKCGVGSLCVPSAVPSVLLSVSQPPPKAVPLPVQNCLLTSHSPAWDKDPLQETLEKAQTAQNTTAVSLARKETLCMVTAGI